MENSLSLAFGSTAFPAAQGRWILRSKRRRELKKKVALLGIVNPSVGFADSSPAGEPFGRHKPKAVPMKWGKWTRTNVSGRKGNIKKQQSCFTVPPQSAAPTAPPQAVAPLTPSVYSLTLIATSLDREAFCVLPRSGESYRLRYILLLYTPLC